MHRWISLLGTIILVLMLWTGGAARAAEPFDCIAVSAEAAGRLDGEREQAPSSPDQCVVHHHSGCSGHHVAAPPNIAANELILPQKLVPFAWREAGRPGRGPDSDLRPPIA